MLLTRMNEKQEELDQIAADFASLGLVCLWYNDTQEASCDPDADGNPAASHQEIEWAMNHAVTPAGTISSEDSLAAANATAKALAEASLNCVFASEAVSVDCCDPNRPGFTAHGQECEPVKDSQTGYGGRNPRVGQAYVESGKITSTISVAEATRTARDIAWSMLECYYVNDTVYESCGLDLARSRGILPSHGPRVEAVVGGNTGQYITVPSGTVVSEVSTKDATEQAQTLALSMLECCFVNSAYRKSCDIVKYIADDGTEIAVNSVSVKEPTSRTV